MEVLKEHINKQLEFNQGKNLFYRNLSGAMGFIPIGTEVIEQVEKLDNNSESQLLDYVVDKVVQELCSVNQYYSINGKAIQDLRAIYSELLRSLKYHLRLSGNKSVKTIAEAHFRNLRAWLKNTNSFAEAIYPDDKEQVKKVLCAQYSANFQIHLFKLDIATVKGPVLDIGCGREGNLVTYFRENGLEATGIDRFEPEKPFLEKSDWLEYDYGLNKWGTIISNLGFSNHFEHHHYRTDGNFMEYAKKYMCILHSLQVTGSFYYAPHLPFIEQYLEEDKYQVKMIATDNLNYKATKVTRLK